MTVARILRLPIAIFMLFSSAAPALASGVDPTKISLPKGPASIEGLGSNFAPTLATGTATYSVSIAVPPAAASFAPSISLEYDAGGGVSELGLGFRLAGLPNVRRRIEHGLPRFDDSDQFELTGLGLPSDLLELKDGYYRPQYETGAFARVQRSADGSEWEARNKAGTTFRFGGDGFVETEDGNIVTYLLREQADLHGHFIRYEWDTSDGHALLERVTWNDFSDFVRQEMLFTYEERPDEHELFSSGIRKRLTRRLKAIEVQLGGELVRRYHLEYASGTTLSQLASVRMVGTDGETALPTLSFEYTQAELAEGSSAELTTMSSPPGRSLADKDVELADLNGDALPDVLVTEAGAYRSYVNQDGKSWFAGSDWAASDSPSLQLSNAGVQLADVDGDGAVDLLAKSGTDVFRYFPGQSESRFAPSVSIASVPNFDLDDPDVRLSDVDGDRRVDVLITTVSGLAIGYNLDGSDWTEPELLGPVDDRQDVLFSNRGTELCDINGDRVQDLCYLRSESLLYWLGRGRGRFEAAREASGVPEFNSEDPWRVHDLNGDGWADLVHVGVNRVSYALSERAGAFSDIHHIQGVPEKTNSVTVEFADMNASGSTDILWVDIEAGSERAWRYLELFPNGRAGLLRAINNGLGKLTHIDYEPAAASAARAREAGTPWSTRINIPMPVVARVEVDAGLGDPLLATEYEYRNGAWDPQERTFAGFGGGIQRELGDEFTPTLITDSTFDTGLIDRILRGALLTTEQRTETGHVFSRTVNDYEVVSLQTAEDGRAIDYAYKTSERVEHIEGSASPRVTLTEWEQDQFGNVTAERRWGEVVGADLLAGNDEALTLRTFANNTDDWILGYLATEEVTDATGRRVAMKRAYYDGDAFEGMPLGEIARGDLTRQEEWKGPDLDHFELDIATAYNADGQPTETIDARGGGRHYEWDPDDHTSLLSERVKLDTEWTLIETAETDRRFGNLLAVTDYSGATLRYGYDPLGRLTEVYKAGDGELPSIRYEYQHGAPLSRVITESRIWADKDEFEYTESLIDGLGRTRGALTRAEDNRWVLAGVALHDARGQARRALRPRWVTEDAVDAPPLLEDAKGVSSWRDALAREVRTRTELGLESRTEHLPLAVKTWDGAQTDPASPYEHLPDLRDVDGLGRTVATTEYLDGNPLTARFTYDPLGQLLSRRDPEGNVSSYAYDGRGQRVLVDDPDLGKRELVYDSTGNLIERRNPDGSVLKYGFDLAGRSLWEDWDGDGEHEVTQHWDTHPDRPDDSTYRGRLALTDEPTGNTEFEYDERGRVLATHINIHGHRYSIGSRFDNLDREYLHIYPDGSSLRIHRNLRGQLAGYGNAITLEHDGDGLELERRFNTGVVQTYGYDEDRRRDALKALDPSGGVIEHLKWAFDGAGNVSSLTDLRGNVSDDDSRSEEYGYDNLYRLRTAQGLWGRIEWDYSSSGNLVSRRSTVPALDAPSIEYGVDAGPHAITTFDGRTVKYDALGRMTSDGERTFRWNTAEQLVGVSKGDGVKVENAFDAQGVRRERISTDAAGKRTTVHFLDAWSEVHDGNLVRYIVHADQRVVRLAEGNGVSAMAPTLTQRQLRTATSLLDVYSTTALGLVGVAVWMLIAQRRSLFAPVR